MAVGVSEGPAAAGGRASQTPAPAGLREGAGPLTFARLKWTSFTHSCVYTGLLVSAFALGKPEPLTLVLGWTHGLLWICMSLACITAARLRIVSLKLAVAVAVLGGVSRSLAASSSSASSASARGRLTLK